MSTPHIPPATYASLTLTKKLDILRRWRDQHEDIEAIAAAEGIRTLEADLRKEYGRRCPPTGKEKVDWTDAENEALRAIYLMPHEKQFSACRRRLSSRTIDACKRQATTLGLVLWSADDLAKMHELIALTPFDKLKAAVAAAFPTRSEMVAWRKALAIRRA